MITRYLLFILLLFGTLFACKKDKPTIVHGKVVDKKTGAPLANAYIDFALDAAGSHDAHVSEQSDMDGNFSYENTIDFGIFNVSKEGYLIKGPGNTNIYLTKGETNNVTINMIPLDGTLRIKIENVTGQFDSIYVLVYSPGREIESTLSGGIIGFDYPELPFTFGEVYSIDIPVVSEENLDIYWGNSPLTNPLSNSPFHASIFVSRNDTVTYSITF